MTVRENKFVVDRMYQKLANWLRILGYDTVCEPNFVDQDFIRAAKAENRILLTRDENLAQRARKLDIKVLTVDAPTIEERMVLLVKAKVIELSLSGEILPRCTKCNGEIQPPLPAGTTFLAKSFS